MSNYTPIPFMTQPAHFTTLNKYTQFAIVTKHNPNFPTLAPTPTPKIKTSQVTIVYSQNKI